MSCLRFPALCVRAKVNRLLWIVCRVKRPVFRYRLIALRIFVWRDNRLRVYVCIYIYIYIYICFRHKFNNWKASDSIHLQSLWRQRGEWHFQMRMHWKCERIKWVWSGKMFTLNYCFWLGVARKRTSTPKCRKYSALRGSRSHVYLVNSRNTPVAHPWGVGGTMPCRRAFKIRRKLYLAAGLWQCCYTSISYIEIINNVFLLQLLNYLAVRVNG